MKSFYITQRTRYRHTPPTGVEQQAMFLVSWSRARFGLLFLAAATVMAASSPQAWLTLDAHVLEVKDGNCLRVIDGKRCIHQIRLSGSDAPELSQPGGMDAKRRLEELVGDKSVRILHRWFDRRGRILGKVYAGDTWINQILIDEGLAWFYDPDGDAPELESHQATAKSRKIGIWQRTNPVPPWWYRLGNISYREGMENTYPRLYPRKKSSNERALIGGGTP